MSVRRQKAETARIDTLRGLAILDTPAEAEYDDLAALAAAACQSEIGAVNFVDGARHWTKAVVGVVDGQGTSVSADVSFCATTVHSDEGMIAVGDTLADARWREHPLVAGPAGIRFYAGASILVEGQAVGVVCVYGHEPRTITGTEQEALAALARAAGVQLELRRSNAELRRLALTDPLTGLANRTLLLDRLGLALAGRGRFGGEVGVLFCDVDDFKSVNDRFGHDAGDRLLCELADALRGATRDADTVARLAGDEFVVVYPRVRGDAEVAAIARRVAADVARNLSAMPDGTPAPHLTIGWSLTQADDDADAALRRADAAMYAAKARV